MTIWQAIGPIMEPIGALLHPSRYHLSCTASDLAMTLVIHVHNTETGAGLTMTTRAQDLLVCEVPGEAEQLGGRYAREFQAALYAPRQVKGKR